MRFYIIALLFILAFIFIGLNFQSEIEVSEKYYAFECEQIKNGIYPKELNTNCKEATL